MFKVKVNGVLKEVTLQQLKALTKEDENVPGNEPIFSQSPDTENHVEPNINEELIDPIEVGDKWYGHTGGKGGASKKKKVAKPNIVKAEKKTELSKLANTALSVPSLQDSDYTLHDVINEIRGVHLEAKVIKRLLKELLKEKMDIEGDVETCSFPFAFPLKHEDLQECESYLNNDENYSNLVLYLSRKLKKEHTKDPDDVLKMLFDDDVFSVVGWSRRDNLKYHRKHANTFKLFTNFITDVNKKVKERIAHYAINARQRLARLRPKCKKKNEDEDPLIETPSKRKRLNTDDMTCVDYEFLSN